MNNTKTLVRAALSLALILACSAVLAQAPKEAPPAPPSGQPPTTVVVPSQAPSPRDTGPTTEVLENPYGIEALWKQGDFVARGTLIILIIMSIGTWIFTSGGGMKGGGGVASFGGGGGGLSGCGGLISSMILVSSGGVTISTILRARPCIRP